MRLNSGASLVILLMLICGCVTSPTQERLADRSIDGIAKMPESGHGKEVINVCKEIKPTDSRIGKRICRPKEVWDEIERNAQQRLENITKPQTNNPREG